MSTETDADGRAARAGDGAGGVAAAAPAAPVVTLQQAADWVIREGAVPLLRAMAAETKEEAAA